MNKKSIYLVVFANLLVILGFTEFILPKIFPVSRTVHKYWDDRPATYWPNMEHRDVTSNYDIYFQSNSLGFKDDDEYTEAKPSNVFRILMLGDSMVDSLGVRNQAKMSKVIQKIALSEGYRIEAIPMGMSGFSQTHQLKNYTSLGRKYSPDMVISFFCFNDVLDNVRNWPIHFLEDGQLVERFSKAGQSATLVQEYLFRGFLNHFDSYYIFRAIAIDLYKRFFNPNSTLDAGRARVLSGRTRDVADPSTPKSITMESVPQDPKYTELFKALVAELKKEVDTDGSKLVSLITPGHVDLDDYHYRELFDWAKSVYQSNGINIIDTREYQRKKYLETGKLPHWFTDYHWNELGQRQAAEQTWGFIKERYDLSAYRIKNQSKNI